MIRAAIYGATGYAGQELIRILLRHGDVEIKHLTTQQYAEKQIADVFPNLFMHNLPTLELADNARMLSEVDVVFLALPHGHAFEVAKHAKKYGTKVIDLGADFRLIDTTKYQEWYGLEHTAPELQQHAVYGLPEMNRAKTHTAWLVANPGCYPTASTLAALPLIENGLIDPKSIIVDAKSGVSGAGRSAKTDQLYAEVNESIKPYGVTTHRHTPEIEQNLTLAGGQEAIVQFTPHLVPMTRGILSTVYANLTKTISEEELRALYIEKYSKEPFVQVLPQGLWPATKMVYGSNNCFINFTIDKRTNRVIAAGVIDNLIKGAAGQAVQNMNLIFALDETQGLQQVPYWP